MSKLGDILRIARERKKLDQVQLGELFGISKSAVNQWESGRNVPDHRKQPRLAEVLDLDLTMIQALAAGAEWPPKSDTSDQPLLFEAAPPPPAPRLAVTEPKARLDAADVPVWASVAAGDNDGMMILTSDPIDYIRRSDSVAKAVDPFAFYIVGESMEDRFYQGDQAVVNRSLPLRPGDDCVFIHTAEDGAMFGLVKRLIRIGSDAWKVRQLNPRKDFDLSRRKWSKAYRVVETRHRS